MSHYRFNGKLMEVISEVGSVCQIQGGCIAGAIGHYMQVVYFTSAPLRFAFGESVDCQSVQVKTFPYRLAATYIGESQKMIFLGALLTTAFEPQIEDGVSVTWANVFLPCPGPSVEKPEGNSVADSTTNQMDLEALRKADAKGELYHGPFKPTKEVGGFFKKSLEHAAKSIRERGVVVDHASSQLLLYLDDWQLIVRSGSVSRMLQLPLTPNTPFAQRYVIHVEDPFPSMDHWRYLMNLDQVTAKDCAGNRRFVQLRSVGLRDAGKPGCRVVVLTLHVLGKFMPAEKKTEEPAKTEPKETVESLRKELNEIHYELSRITGNGTDCRNWKAMLGNIEKELEASRSEKRIG